MPIPVLAGLGSLIATSLVAFGKQLVKYGLQYGGPFVLQVLLFFGISMSTLEFGVEPFVAQLQGYLTGAPQFFVDTLAFVGADIAITMILSAYVTRSVGKIIFRKAA
jgi:hypothetical protein